MRLITNEQNIIYSKARLDSTSDEKSNLFVNRSRGEFLASGKEERKMHRVILKYMLFACIGWSVLGKTKDRLLLS